MKKLFFAIAALSVFAACSTNEETVTPDSKQYVSAINATLDETRAHLSGAQVKWNKGDIVTIYNRNEAVEYVAQNEDAETSTTLLPKDGVGITAKAGPYYAIYGPSAATVDVDNEKFTVTLPTVQNYFGNGTFGKDAHVMYSVASDLNVDGSSSLTFANFTSLLRINVRTSAGEGTVKSVAFSVEDGYLTGGFSGAKIDMNEDDYWTPPMVEKIAATGDNNGREVTLMNCDQEINSTAYSTFYIVVPDGKYTNPNINVTIEYNGKAQIYGARATGTIEVKQGTIKTIGGNGLTFDVAPLKTYAVGAEVEGGIVYELTGVVVNGEGTSGNIVKALVDEEGQANMQYSAVKVDDGWRLANDDDIKTINENLTAVNAWSKLTSLNIFWTGTITDDDEDVYNTYYQLDPEKSGFTQKNKDNVGALEVKSFVSTERE